MRRSLLIGIVAVVLLAPAITPASASSGPSGSYGTPFREDGATFDPATGSFTGQGGYDSNGCLSQATNGPQGNPDAYRCLPAGATLIQLNDGRVLYWNALEGTENFGQSIVVEGGRLTVNDEARLLTLGPNGTNPRWALPAPVDGGAHQTSTNEDLHLGPLGSTAQHYPYNNGSLFCSDQVQLAGGQILTVGGTDYYNEPSVPTSNTGVIELEGLRNTRIFDPSTNSWTQGPAMNFGRWYPSLVTLSDGKVFVASGVTKLIKPLYSPSSGDNSQLTDSGTNVKHTETYDGTQWTDNGTFAQRSLPLFPRLHLLPDGHVYYDGAGQDYNPQGQSYDEALWNVAGSYDPDPAHKTWTDLGVPGAGTPFPGFRGSTFSAALPLVPNHAGKYSSASFLTAGGVLGTTPGSYLPVADSRITTVATDGSGGEKLSSVGTGPLGRARWYSTAVPLPDGTVYAVNGADLDEVVTPGYESPIRTAELFTPTTSTDGAGNLSYTGGSWRDVGTVARGRTYHNTAMLLPDGSVLIGGHAPIPSGYGKVQDGPTIPGVREGANNHHDPSFQIWQPPYFSNPARPAITSLSTTTITRGQFIAISTPQAGSIASVVLVRATALTHLVDGDARQVELPIRAQAGGVVVADVPNGAVLPAGPYLLFINKTDSGTGPGQVLPSVGQIVSVR